jgi:hypothetical protein
VQTQAGANSFVSAFMRVDAGLVTSKIAEVKMQQIEKRASCEAPGKTKAGTSGAETEIILLFFENTKCGKRRLINQMIQVLGNKDQAMQVLKVKGMAFPRGAFRLLKLDSNLSKIEHGTKVYARIR